MQGSLVRSPYCGHPCGRQGPKERWSRVGRAPTFRFSGVAYAKLTPHHASAAGCRRSLLSAVGCCCCCRRCCQPSPGVWHVRGTHDAVLRRSSQDRGLAGYAKVRAKIGGQKIQVGLPCARKTVEVIVEADTWALRHIQLRARSSSFCKAAPFRIPGTTRAKKGRAADARVSVVGVTARLEFSSHESNCSRWLMSKPSAVATRPGLSFTPMLASADDAMQSRPVSPRLARPKVSWSQSRSQDHSREWRLRHVPGRSLQPLTRTGRFAAGTAVARPRASGRSGTGSRSPVSRPSSA